MLKLVYKCFDIIEKIEPPHPKRGWGFLNFFSLNGLI